MLLVGGGVAAARCARTLRRNRFEGSILLVGEEPVPPYNRPPLSKELLRGEGSEELIAAEPPGWYERHSVQLLTATLVERLDAGERRAVLSDGRTVRFERCLIATGARPNELPVPGGGSALLLRTAEDALRLRDAAAAAAGGPALVVGGGLIGVEVASGLAALGLRPTIVERTDALWAGSMGRLLSDWAAERLAAAGVSVRLGAGVDALDADAAWLDGERLPAGLVVAGVGVSPRDELARDAGIDTARGIAVGGNQRTSQPAIWAAGDVARVEGSLVEHWHAAREAGERAALSMLGLAVPPRPVPWIFSEVAGIAVDVFGEGEPGDDEEWVVEEAVLARSRAGRVVQLAVIGSAIAPDSARRAMADGITSEEVRGLVAT